MLTRFICVYINIDARQKRMKHQLVEHLTLYMYFLTSFMALCTHLLTRERLVLKNLQVLQMSKKF